jgi:hypothetical protein
MFKHNLFPTLITEHSFLKIEDIKTVFFNNALNHCNKDGYSMETTGNVDIHLDREFDILFDWVIKCVKDHMNCLNIQDNFDLNLVKTWFNITRDFHTPNHTHADAHISFVYYVHLPKDYDKPIYFGNNHVNNELFYGMNNNNIKEWNELNTPTWYFIPKEGTLFVFPGKLSHWTAGHGSGAVDPGCHSIQDLTNRRCAIAGDILLTYKTNKLCKPYGIQPTMNWKTYNV